LLSQMTTSLATQFTDSEVDRAESEIELLKTEWLMENHLKMDAEAFEKLNRKVSVLDLDINDCDVVVRADLDVPLSSFSALPPLDEEFKEFLQQQEEEAQLSGKKKPKKSKKQLEEEAEMQARYDAGKQAREEPWKVRQIQDQKLIKRTEQSIKVLQEKQPKRIFLLSSLGEKCGRVKNENSVRALLPQLQSQIQDIPIQYMSHEQVAAVAQNGTEDLKESTLYVVENLNFKPDEHSFVEAWIEPEDPNKKQEEEKKDVMPPVDPKKLSPAERKKYEEEQKRKAEEEALRPQPTQAEIDRELRIQKAREEAAEQRKIDDYFDYKTTNKYL
jgi:hypothetical protein